MKNIERDMDGFSYYEVRKCDKCGKLKEYRYNKETKEYYCKMCWNNLKTKKELLEWIEQNNFVDATDQMDCIYTKDLIEKIEELF